MKLFLVIKIIF